MSTSEDFEIDVQENDDIAEIDDIEENDDIVEIDDIAEIDVEDDNDVFVCSLENEDEQTQRENDIEGNFWYESLHVEFPTTDTRLPIPTMQIDFLSPSQLFGLFLMTISLKLL